MHHRGSIKSSVQLGFTLVELLIVIGIIAVLVGILLPVVGKVKISGQKVATQNTLNRLSQGIEAYFQDFGSYPGPFSDDQIISSAMTTTPTPTPQLGTSGLQLQYPDPTNPTVYTALGHAPTSSENLFLGLCGGLKVTVNNLGVPNGFHYEPTLALRGAGPAGLSQNVTNYKKSQAYLDITAADVTADESNANPLNMAGSAPSQWWPGAPAGPALVGPFLGDSYIHEFVDRFSKPMPILYMRAQRGVSRAAALITDKSGFIFDAINLTYATAPWQYRPDQIEYGYASLGKVPSGHTITSLPGNLMSGDLYAGRVWTADGLDYPDLPLDPNNAAGTKKILAGNDRYYANETLSTGDPTPAATNDPAKSLVPVYKDKYILISAGPDGIYGTADDIRN